VTARRAAGASALAALVVWWWATRFGDGTRTDLDAVLYFLPTYAATWERFQAGVVPLWNPYQLCGIPWIATLQGGTFYPFHVVYGLLPLHTGMAVSGVLHLVIAALGTAAFVGRFGLPPAAALLAAVAFVLRGQVASALASPNLLEAIAWLPVGAVAIVDLVRAPGGRPAALLALGLAMSFLAGYPQPTVYVVYAWGTLFLALLIHERPPAAGSAARVGWFAAALVLGGAVASVQLLPALELMAQGTRGGALVERELFPYVPGLTPAVRILWWETISGATTAFGIVVLTLLPAAVLAPGLRVVGCWALGVAALSQAWALGRHSPLFDLYLATPGLALFRNPARILFVTDFAVAVAAALGLSAATGCAPADTPEARPRAPTVALMALALATVLYWVVRHGAAPQGGSSVVWFAVATAVILALLLSLRGRWRRWFAVAITVAATIEIAGNPWTDFRLPYEQSDLAEYEHYAPELAQIAAMAGQDRAWQALPGLQLARAEKLATRHRLRTIGDYEPVNLRRQAEFFNYFADGATTPRRPPWLFAGSVGRLDAPEGGTPPGARRRLLDLAAVRWVILPRLALVVPVTRDFIARAGLVRRHAFRDLVVMENPAALPRAFVTYRARSAPADADALLAALSDPRFDPLAESFVDGPPPFAMAPDAPPRGHPAGFVHDDEAEVELEVRLERNGLVVLADSHFPGWHATVDGAPVPIVATNHLFRGVPVPAGTHRVRFVYAPASVRIGALTSGLGLLVMVGLALRPRRAGGTPGE
jgi:hypothetical protein